MDTVWAKNERNGVDGAGAGPSRHDTAFRFSRVNDRFSLFKPPLSELILLPLLRGEAEVNDIRGANGSNIQTMSPHGLYRRSSLDDGTPDICARHIQVGYFLQLLKVTWNQHQQRPHQMINVAAILLSMARWLVEKATNIARCPSALPAPILLARVPASC